jgi:sugar O-acyltransferase (sialic acid O-acetyltransferase NeuD family)
MAGAPILGSLETVGEYPDAEILLCVGAGVTREAMARRLGDLGVGIARYARVVHPDLQLPDSCTIGAGSIVLAGVVLTVDVVVGKHVVIMPNVTLTHGNRISSFATLCAGVTLGGEVRVEEAAYLGMNACVRQRVRIGSHSTIGMAAAVLTNVPAHETWLGVPARRYENGQNL